MADEGDTQWSVFEITWRCQKLRRHQVSKPGHVQLDAVHCYDCIGTAVCCSLWVGGDGSFERSLGLVVAAHACMLYCTANTASPLGYLDEAQQEAVNAV